MSTEKDYDQDPEDNKETPKPENTEEKQAESQEVPEESSSGISDADDFQKFLSTITDLDPAARGVTARLSDDSGTSNQLPGGDNKSGDQSNIGDQNPDHSVHEDQISSEVEKPAWLAELGVIKESPAQTKDLGNGKENEYPHRPAFEFNKADEFQEFLRNITNLDPITLEPAAPAPENSAATEQISSEHNEPGPQSENTDQNSDQPETEPQTSNQEEGSDWFSELENDKPPSQPENETNEHESELLIEHINSLRQDIDEKTDQETPPPPPKQPWWRRFKQYPPAAPPPAPVPLPFLLEDSLHESVDNSKNSESLKAEESIEDRQIAFTPRQLQISKEKQELNWKESDTRLLELQESFDNLTPAAVAQETSFFGQLKSDFEEANLLTQGLTIFAVVFIVVLVIFIGYGIFQGNRAADEPEIQSITTLPVPGEILFPGGWKFALKQGAPEKGKWNPTGPEWLQGTEICRLVSVPWNKQLEAVYNAIAPGDEFVLKMSNGDVLAYKVETTQTIKLAELDQIANRHSPSLVVVLTKQDTDLRQIVIAAMNLTPTAAPTDLNANKTATP